MTEKEPVLRPRPSRSHARVESGDDEVEGFFISDSPSRIFIWHASVASLPNSSVSNRVGWPHAPGRTDRSGWPLHASSARPLL